MPRPSMTERELRQSTNGMRALAATAWRVEDVLHVYEFELVPAERRIFQEAIKLLDRLATQEEEDVRG